MPDEPPASTAAPAAAVEIDYETLTLDEIDLVEETANASLNDMMAGRVRTGKVLRAFALVALRRTDPDATADQIGKLTMTGVGELLGDNARPPTRAAGSRPSSSSAASRRPAASRSTGSRS